MNRYRRIITIALALLLIVGVWSCASAANIVYGGSGQVNPQRTAITGEGMVSSGYGRLNANYYGFSLGGGVRAEWLSNTDAFEGLVKIELWRKGQENVKIAEHSAKADFDYQVKDTQAPRSPYYVPGYSGTRVNILLTQHYAYIARSTGIPSTVKIQYLCFLYDLD